MAAERQPQRTALERRESVQTALREVRPERTPADSSPAASPRFWFGPYLVALAALVAL